MADAVDLLENLAALDVEQIATSILKSNEEIMADLNATQLSQSMRTDGTEIFPSYKGLTIHIKETMKSGLAAVTDRVTLYDTGDHYRQLYAKVMGRELEFGSKDEKSAKLEKKYATSKGALYGLTEDSRDELVESHLRPEWAKDISSKTGLKFVE
jgi:hypothetical protein